MVKMQIDFSKNENKFISLIKIKKNFKTKSETVKYLIKEISKKEYDQEINKEEK